MTKNKQSLDESMSLYLELAISKLPYNDEDLNRLRINLPDSHRSYIDSWVSSTTDDLTGRIDDLNDIGVLAGSLHLYDMYKSGVIDTMDLIKDPLWSTKLPLELIKKGLIHPGRDDITKILNIGRKIGLYTQEEISQAMVTYSCKFILRE